MSYNVAYTSSFQSLEGVAWRVDIYMQDHAGDPTVISLDGESPVVIEWQETKVYDSVCPSLCTVKVVSETDRQMIGLMSASALCVVYRNDSVYWKGLIDDCIYEEPYSYRRNYVTEISFADFGCLNRSRFTMSGRHSFYEVLYDILGSTDLFLDVNRSFSIQTADNEGFDFNAILIDTDMFSAGEGCSKYDALERLLKPFGLRIIQLNGFLYLHDLEYMREHNAAQSVVWQGTDARIRGSETYGTFNISANLDNETVLADLFEHLAMPTDPILEDGSYAAMMWVENESTNEGSGQRAYRVYPVPWYNNDRAAVLRGGVAEAVHELLDHDDRFVFERARVLSFADSSLYQGITIPYDPDKDLGSYTTPHSASSASEIIRIETDPIPLVPNRADFLLRINLDLLFSPKKVPQLDPSDYNTPSTGDNHTKYKFFQANLRKVYVPVKLEAIDNHGNAVKHVHNHQWIDGPAGFGDMELWYYSDNSGTPLEEWVTNKHWAGAIERYKKRKDGEYIPLPDIPCRVRLTVSNAVVGVVGTDYNSAAYLSYFDPIIRWQAYKNARITLVNAGWTDEDTDKDLSVGDVQPDMDEYSEEHDLLVFEKGVPPSAKGLVTDGGMNAMETFHSNGSDGTLLQLRLESLRRQLFPPRPVLSGTARLTPEFAVFTDANTEGRFLRVGAIQDLLADTEQITLLNITPDDPAISAPKYSFSWSGPVCALRDISYRHEWSSPVCFKTTVPDHYTFTWSSPVCAYINIAIELEWEEF